MKEFLFMIITFLALGAIIVAAALFTGRPNYLSFEGKAKYTAGEVYSLGKTPEIRYKVNEKTYTSLTSRSNGYTLNDKFLVVYDSLNPKSSDVLAYEPLFGPDEETAQTSGVTENPRWRMWGNMVFRYEVEGKSYIRNQKLPPDWKDRYPNVDKGQKYLVRYWAVDPQRSIIYLDSLR